MTQTALNQYSEKDGSIRQEDWDDDDELLDGGYTDSGEGQEMFEHYSLPVDKGQGLLRIDKYLTAHIEGVSRHRIQLAIDAGYVHVNGNPVKANYKVKPLDGIKIFLPYRRRGFEILPEKMDLDIRYEDEDVLVINKPAGLVVHPGCGHFTGTLLIAKNDDAQAFLARQFFVHSIERKYTAIVWGDMEQDEGTITGNIIRDPNDRLRFKVSEDSTQGKHAVTHYRVIERLGYVTVVECILETGRTHQIRVHMNHIGHPLFNDSRYGGDRILKGTLYSKYRQFIDNCFEILPRQALHAGTIGFIHPRTRTKITVSSGLPDDMTALIGKFRTFVSSRKNQ